jgi:PKD repeat protein
MGADTLNPTFVVDKLGSYTVQLTVSDGSLSSTGTVLISTTPQFAPADDDGGERNDD